jgi:hypothetical protein
MTHNIVKFASGFFGLQVISSGEIVRADLIRWDGKRGTSYSYNTGDSFEYYIDAANTVYYTDGDGKDARVWCAGKRLNDHCRHLAQIMARA